MLSPLVALLVAAVAIGLLHFLFWPETGLFPRLQRARRMTERVLIEDALKNIHSAEMRGDLSSVESIADELQITEKDTVGLIEKMIAGDLILQDDDAIRLTESGKQSALHILRAHRLWERYLADATGFSEDEWHSRAEEREHFLTSSDADLLSAQLGHPTLDPHGDPIPSADGELISIGGIPLSQAETDTPLRIIHIEDEPPTIYAQLVAEGLHPGMILRVTESSPQRVRFWANGDEHVLAPILAANITILPLAKDDEAPIRGKRLTTLKPGEKGEVVGISPACRGLERRRMLDLGIIPGTAIEAAYNSPSGDPMAYLVRDTLIALREDQARMIYIQPMEIQA